MFSMGSSYAGLVMDANGDPNWTPQRHEFWVTHTINAFHGAPHHLGIWMSRRHFDTILSALSFTDAIPPPPPPPPTSLHKCWEI